MLLASLALVTLQDPTGEAAGEAQKHLTLYELDLGLNHVVRKWSEPVDNGANLLIPVPGGGTDGPGGVLVCAENFIIYKNEDHPDVRAVIPRRSSLSEERGVLIVSYATHKQKTLIFFFVQASRFDCPAAASKSSVFGAHEYLSCFQLVTHVLEMLTGNADRVRHSLFCFEE